MTPLEVVVADAIERARLAEKKGVLDHALIWYEHALRQLKYDGTPAQATELMRWIGTVHRQRGDLELAYDAYETSRKIAEMNGLTRSLASALNCLASVAQLRGQIPEAEELYQRARSLAVEVDDQRLTAIIDQNLGTLANTRGDVLEAIDSYSSALSRFRLLGDSAGTTWSLINLGMAHVDLHAWSAAEVYFDEAFELAHQQDDTGLLGMVELNRAELYLKQRDFERAHGCCDRAFEIFSRFDSRSHLGEAYKFYGVLYREMQRPVMAEANLQAAVDLALNTEDRLLEAETQTEWALVDLHAGRNAQALQRLNRAHRLFTDLHASADLLDIDARLDKLEENYLRVVQQWAESIEAKDHYTAGHCERVANYACLLAEARGYTGRDLTWFRMGGFLHDVGKTAVPSEVLNKAGKLTGDEWRIMQSHTTVGDEIVAALNFPWDIRPLVRNHHERWDGTGYPDGLAGEQIPLTARILCVADVYDALTTARSYRSALSRDEALRIMEGDVGKAFDPELFRVFSGLVAPEMCVAA